MKMHQLVMNTYKITRNKKNKFAEMYKSYQQKESAKKMFYLSKSQFNMINDNSNDHIRHQTNYIQEANAEDLASLA